MVLDDDHRFSSYILSKKKPDQVSDQAVLVNVRFTVRPLHEPSKNIMKMR